MRFQVVLIILAIVVSIFLGNIGAPALASSASEWEFNDNPGWQNFFDGFFKRKLEAKLDGYQEISEGDKDGLGQANIKLKLNQEEICIDMRVVNIDPATAAHIYKAPKGEKGDLVVNLPIPNENGVSSACVSVPEDVLASIREHPDQYYINVHTSAFPNGAVRGQLAN